jgi:hypothetical protein
MPSNCQAGGVSKKWSHQSWRHGPQLSNSLVSHALMANLTSAFNRAKGMKWLSGLSVRSRE